MYVAYCAEKCCLFLMGCLAFLRVQISRVMVAAGISVQGWKDATQPHGTCMKHTLADVVEIDLNAEPLRPASAELRTLYKEEGQNIRRQDTRHGMWIAIAVYLLFRSPTFFSFRTSQNMWLHPFRPSGPLPSSCWKPRFAGMPVRM